MQQCEGGDRASFWKCGEENEEEMISLGIFHGLTFIFYGEKIPIFFISNLHIPFEM